VALTFDAGGGDGGVAKILRTLRDSGVPATFFLTGHWARAFPDQVARISRGGYAFGNHTDTHSKVTPMSDAHLRSELRTTNAAVRRAAGRGTKPWFRFPYGTHTPHDIARVNDLGYACIQWSVDTAGWMGTSGGQSVDTVVARVVKGLVPGEIVLMHVGEHPVDGSTLDADALPRIISTLRSRGYEFTTLADLVSTTGAH
jgi:peptidoglycan/xylan/chitin deacetylase (PgdA/CDA1 family)